MTGIEAHFTDLVKQSAKAPNDAYEHWQAFTSAIDWSESWIQVMLAFHCVLFFIAMFFRRSIEVQMCVFAVISILVFSAEYINTLCRDNWTSFAKQNYFDEHGTFASSLFCAPLLFISFCQLVSLLLLASSALIKAKRLELRKRAEDNKAAKKTDKKRD